MTADTSSPRFTTPLRLPATSPSLDLAAFKASVEALETREELLLKKSEIETLILELKVKLQDAHSKWWPDNKNDKVLTKTYYGYKKQLAELSAITNIIDLKIDLKLMQLRAQQRIADKSKSLSFEKAFIEAAKELLTGKVFNSIAAATNARMKKQTPALGGGLQEVTPRPALANDGQRRTLKTRPRRGKDD